MLDGSSYVETDPLPHSFREKSFAAWVSLISLDQSGGGAMTLQVPGKDFSIRWSLVNVNCGWMAGSNGFLTVSILRCSGRRHRGRERPVHMVLTYAEDGTIRAFRNGVPYGSAYKSQVFCV